MHHERIVARQGCGWNMGRHRPRARTRLTAGALCSCAAARLESRPGVCTRLGARLPAGCGWAHSIVKNTATVPNKRSSACVPLFRRCSLSHCEAQDGMAASASTAASMTAIRCSRAASCSSLGSVLGECLALSACRRPNGLHLYAPSKLGRGANLAMDSSLCVQCSRVGSANQLRARVLFGCRLQEPGCSAAAVSKSTAVTAPRCSRALLHNLQLTSDRCLIFASHLATGMIPAIVIISRLLCLQGTRESFTYFPKNALLSFCRNMKSAVHVPYAG